MIDAIPYEIPLAVLAFVVTFLIGAFVGHRDGYERGYCDGKRAGGREAIDAVIEETAARLDVDLEERDELDEYALEGSV